MERYDATKLPEGEWGEFYEFNASYAPVESADCEVEPA